MSSIKYTEDHEWIKAKGDEATVGITEYAQDSLGDLVFIELPEKGKSLSKGDEAAVVESVKAASEVYAPASGEVTEVNDSLNDDPGIVNSSPQDKGWFFKMKLSDAGELEDLMDESKYKEFLKDLS